jgi:TRAP-type C4-dicarboxylate transport system substrate-binding protein
LKRTNGKYQIDVFPASSLGKESDIVEGLSLGSVDIVYAGSAFIGNTYGPIAMGEAPFMFEGFDHFWNLQKAHSLKSCRWIEKASKGNKITANNELRRPAV